MEVSQVTQESSVYVPFYKLKPEAQAVRSELRAKLAAMRLTDGHRLRASFSGSVPQRSDVENLLLYNIFDGSSRHLLAGGVTFELDPRPRVGYEYRYRTGPQSEDFDFWKTGNLIAQVEDVPVTGHKLAQVWWEIHQSPLRDLDLGFQDQRYCVHVLLQRDTLSVEVIKGFLDGLVCAFQFHTHALDAPRRIASKLRIDELRIRQCLENRERAALGSASAPLRCVKKGVQWHPDDTRLVAAAIRFTPTPRASSRLTATFYKAEQKGVPDR